MKLKKEFIGARVKVSQLKTFVTVSAESADLLLQHGHTELFEKDEYDYPKKLAESPSVDGRGTKRRKPTKVISVQNNERPNVSSDTGTDSTGVLE